ncbi:MAG: type IV pilus assembly protein PilM [Candidatus Omnitrophota bacterium]
MNKLPAFNFPSRKILDAVNPLLAKIKGFLPEEKPRTTVGLDIGTTSVKLVQVQRIGKELQITAYGIAAIKNGDREEAIKKLFAECCIFEKEVNIAISGHGVVLRYLSMPKVPPAELKASIIFEADKHIPFPIAEVVVDCYTIKDLPKENKSLVLLAAAKKDFIEQRLALLNKLGLSAGVVSVDAVALANVFNVLWASDNLDQTVGLLSIGGAFSSLNLIDSGVPLFTRDIFIGGEDITKRIMNQFGMDMPAAQKLKTSAEKDAQRIIASCETILSNLVTEIRFSFDYFETEYNLPISVLYLTGGSAYLPGLDNHLQQGLGIKVEAWNPLARLKSGPQVQRESLEKDANLLGVALGLALYGND